MHLFKIKRSLPEVSKDGSRIVTDEEYNTFIAALGAVLSVVGTFFLIFHSIVAGKPWHILSFFIYGIFLISMFAMSALHHGVNGSKKTEHLLRQFDYFAIFSMIAGSLTPFCLIVLRTTLGWSVLILMWVVAIGGVLLKAFFPGVPKWVTTPIYLGMGWLGLSIVYPTYQVLTWKGMAFFFLGGLLYTVGAVIYFLEKPNPFPGKFGFHEIWHLFVLGAAASHFYLMYAYLLPY